MRSCDSGSYKLINFESEGDDANFTTTIIGNRVCDDDPEEGVEIYGLDLSGQNPLELDMILKCKDGFLPVILQNELTYSNLDYNQPPADYAI